MELSKNFSYQSMWNFIEGLGSTGVMNVMVIPEWKDLKARQKNGSNFKQSSLKDMKHLRMMIETVGGKLKISWKNLNKFRRKKEG